LEFGRKPGGGGRVADVIGVKERDQHVDIEECAHSVRVLLTQPIDLLVRNETAATFEWYEAADSGTGRLSRSARECAASEFGEHGSGGSI
jgi:hypothetical protein